MISGISKMHFFPLLFFSFFPPPPSFPCIKTTQVVIWKHELETGHLLLVKVVLEKASIPQGLSWSCLVSSRFKTSVFNGSCSIEFNRRCVRSLQPNEPSVLTSLSLLKQRCVLFPWSSVSHWVSYNSPPHSPRVSVKAVMAIGALNHGKDGLKM